MKTLKMDNVKTPKSEGEIKLDKVMQNITNNCKTTDEHTLLINNHQSYLEINLNNNNDFRKGSYILMKKAKEELTCLTDVIKNQSELFIVITGHANDSDDEHKNQNISDNRAISVAELFFNLGIRDEIFAKGCAYKTPYTQREVKLYIYSDKSSIQNHCK